MWIEFKIESPTELRESLSNFLMEEGAHGIQETDTHLIAYLPEAQQLGQKLEIYCRELEALFPNLAKVSVEQRELVDVAWEEKWKEYCYPQPISARFFLKPSWATDAEVPNGLEVIELDPGMAFGTGLHESTRLCLQFLEGLEVDSKNFALLDVGTGSGILSIAASKLGYGQVLGVDVDGEAVTVAKANLERNGCSDVEMRQGSLEGIRDTHDVVLSNILLATHEELMLEYLRVLKPTGQIIFSGLLAGQKEEFDQLIMRSGFQATAWRTENSWLGCLAKRANSE